MNDIGLHAPVERVMARAIPKNENYATRRGTETRSHVEFEGLLNSVGLHGPVERAIPKEQELCNENHESNEKHESKAIRRTSVDFVSLFFIQQIGASNQ
jgi:hypothetical protein